MRWLILLAALALAACEVAPTPPAPIGTEPVPQGRWTPEQAAVAFRQVVERVEPVAERECRQQTRGVNCDFRIQVDGNTRAAPNAFQSLGDDGRPNITFTIALIAEVRNEEELAFVLSHEAAHHIQGHLARQAQNAAAGAEIFAGLAAITGGNAADVETAQEIGAFVGSRSYSREFELEADELGTIITHLAGYDPLKGAQFFARIPDPGNQFLGTHPPNAERYQRVVQTMARLK
ncbi:MAG: M48 family metallopeptidase [Pseudomonadota bacterium]